jgi:hypothetical protein
VLIGAAYQWCRVYRTTAPSLQAQVWERGARDAQVIIEAEDQGPSQIARAFLEGGSVIRSTDCGSFQAACQHQRLTAGRGRQRGSGAHVHRT